MWRGEGPIWGRTRGPLQLQTHTEAPFIPFQEPRSARAGTGTRSSWPGGGPPEKDSGFGGQKALLTGQTSKSGPNPGGARLRGPDVSPSPADMADPSPLGTISTGQGKISWQHICGGERAKGAVEIQRLGEEGRFCWGPRKEPKADSFYNLLFAHS